MPTKNQLLLALCISFVIAIFTFAPLNNLSIFTTDGMVYAFGGGLVLFLGPLLLCSIPAGVHWLIWKEKLNGNELSLWVIWILSWFILSLTTIGEVFFK